MKPNQKRLPIKDLRPDDRLEQVFLVSSRELRQSKAGKPFIQAELQDASGRIKAMMWDAAPAIAADMPPESFILAKVRVEQYQGATQLVIESFRPIDSDKVDMADFLAHTEKDINQLWEQTLNHLRKIKDKPLLQLIKQFVGDEQLMERFRSCPAAVKMHHAYVGGLLEHTENMLATALRILPGYPQLNADLLLVGIFLHDMGKTAELDYSLSIKFTDAGNLLRHLVQGVLLVEDKARLAGQATGGQFPRDTLDQVMHIILSHHGQYDYGSPVLPATAEALLVHHLDNIDAKLNGLQQALATMLPDDGNWTSWMKMFDRQMYRPTDSEQ